MALDSQSNWNVEMSQPLNIPLTINQRNEPSKQLTSISPLHNPSSREILLPIEIIEQILSYIPRQEAAQSSFWACTLVSRSWYSAGVSYLYSQPFLDGSNFSPFVSTICPSKNAHIRLSALSALVRRLDMSNLVHNSSRSLTARILGRLKPNLEEFIAPQASFGINSFAALGKCTRLRVLNLSLISASISNKLLFQILQSLQELETLFFPRSSSEDQVNEETPYDWPPKLNALHLAGSIDDHFLYKHLVNVPSSLEKLSIQHCPQVRDVALAEMLRIVGPQLKHLTIRHPMSHLYPSSLDSVLKLCPSLIALRISAEYISNALFYIRSQLFSSGDPFPEGSFHPLQILDIECSPSVLENSHLTPDTLYTAVEEDDLPNLRSVRVSSRLAWEATREGRCALRDLQEVMEDKDVEVPLGLKIGVWCFAD